MNKVSYSKPEKLTRAKLGPPLDTVCWVQSPPPSPRQQSSNLAGPISCSMNHGDTFRRQLYITYCNILLAHISIPTADIIAYAVPRDCRAPKDSLNNPVRGTRNTWNSGVFSHYINVEGQVRAAGEQYKLAAGRRLKTIQSALMPSFLWGFCSRLVAKPLELRLGSYSFNTVYFLKKQNYGFQTKVRK